MIPPWLVKVFLAQDLIARHYITHLEKSQTPQQRLHSRGWFQTHHDEVGIVEYARIMGTRDQRIANYGYTLAR